MKMATSATDKEVMRSIGRNARKGKDSARGTEATTTIKEEAAPAKAAMIPQAANPNAGYKAATTPESTKACTRAEKKQG